MKRLKALGRTRNQRFLILPRHPFSSSGRKGSGYSFVSWLRFALSLTLFQGRAVRDKRFAEKWYDGRR